MAKTVRSRKAKGFKYQKDVAKRIRGFFGLAERDVVSTPSSVQGEDILLSEAAIEVFPLSIECKNQESLSIWKALEQAEKNIKEGTYPALFFKRNRSKSYVTMSEGDFMSLILFYTRMEKNDDLQKV